MLWVDDKDNIDNLLSIFSLDDLKIDTVFRTYPPYTIHGNITLVGLEKLKNNLHIQKITIVHTFSGSLQDSVPLINADDSWLLQLNNRNITGFNITVCVVDTGVNYTHSDLGGCFGSGCKVVAGEDFVDPLDSDPMDDNGHGTHVAGIITANGSKKGIAPESNIAAVKSLDWNKTGTETNIRQGIEWCIDNRNTYNIKVLSLSLGSGLYNSTCDGVDTIVNAANNARTYGILTIASSGNSGSISSIGSPACGSNITSVSATTKGDIIDTDYANRNNITDLVAPGTIINSTNITAVGSSAPTYGVKSGTSMAVPYVAGVAALMKQANSSLAPAEIENLLKETGRPIYDPGTGLTFPRVDALKAVLSAYNDLVVTSFQTLNTSNLDVTFEFRIFNSENRTLTDVGWKIETGEIIINSTVNITIKPYEEAFVYASYTYSAGGNHMATAYATSDYAGSNEQNVSISISGPNLKLTNFTILNSSGSERTFEFFIENNGTTSASNLYWNMTVTNEAGVNGTAPITLDVGKKAFVYVRYSYTTGGLHNVTATADPTNSIVESNENDNSMTISNN